MDDILKLHYKALAALHEKKTEEARELFLSLSELFEKAKKETRKRADFNIVCLSTYRSLGELLHSAENYQDSIFYILKAVAIDSKDLTLWFSLAKSAFKNCSFEIALNSYEEVLKLNPNHLLALDAAIPLAIALSDFVFAFRCAEKLFSRKNNSLTAIQCFIWLHEMEEIKKPPDFIPVLPDIPMEAFESKIDEIKKKAYNPFDHLCEPKSPESMTISLNRFDHSNENESETSSNLFSVLKNVHDFFTVNAPKRCNIRPIKLEGHENFSSFLPVLTFVGTNTVDDIFLDEVASKKIEQESSADQKMDTLELNSESNAMKSEMARNSSLYSEKSATFDSSDNENLAQKKLSLMEQKEQGTSTSKIEETSKDAQKGVKKRLMFSSGDEITEGVMMKANEKATEATQKVTFCSLSSSNDDHSSSLFGQESAPMIALQKNLFDLNSQSDAAKNQQLQQKGPEINEGDMSRLEINSNSSNDEGANPFLNRVLKELKTSVKYDEFTASKNARNLDKDTTIWVSKKHQKLSMEPIYEDLLKFVPVFLHPNHAIRSEQLFAPEVVKLHENSHDEKSENSEKFSEIREVSISKEHVFDAKLLKVEFRTPHWFYFEILKHTYNYKMTEKEWKIYSWIYSNWRLGLNDSYVWDLKEIDDTWNIVAYMTEAIIIREFLSHESVKTAKLKKSSVLVKEHKYVFEDVEFLVSFVHENPEKFGKSYFMWCFRVTFLNGLILLLTNVNLEALKFVKFASLNFESVSYSKKISAIRYTYGNRELKVNRSYLENLFVQVRIRVGTPSTENSSTISQNSESENESRKQSNYALVIENLEPVLNNLTEAKKDISSLISNLRKLKSNLANFWKSSSIMIAEISLKFSIIQLKTDIATIEIYLGSYVLTKGKDFNTEDIWHHLENMLNFSNYLLELSTEYKMRLVHCMLTILHITINRAKCLPIDGLNVMVNTDELEKLKPLIIKTATPWIILAKLIEKEERNSKDNAAMFNHLSPESKEESQLPMFIKFLMEGHEYSKEGLGFCNFSDGLLMHRIIEALTEILNDQSLTIAPHYRRVYEEELDQCYYCLYQLKRAKAKTESHCQNTSVLQLCHVERVFRHFLPPEKPSFDNKKPKLTNDEATMMKRIFEICWRDFENDSKMIVFKFDQAIEECLKSEKFEDLDVIFSTVPQKKLLEDKLKPCVIEMLHYLADYFKHGLETENAMKFTILTLFFNPGNLDSWVVLSLCKKWLIESQFLDIEIFPTIEDVLKVSKIGFLCFRKAISIQKEKIVISTLYIELGLLYYQLCSFIRRSKDFQETQNCYSITSSTEDFYKDCFQCFTEALKICNFEDKWLCHYMFGKITQKLNPPNPSIKICKEVLEHYLKSIQLLEKMGAKLPRKITTLTPQQFSVEILELIYRLFASAIKMIDQNNFLAIHEFLRNVMSHPFMDKHLMKDDEQQFDHAQSSKIGLKTNPKGPISNPSHNQIVSVSSDSSDERSRMEKLNEIRTEILNWCSEVFVACARRYARHAKSLYRLCDIHKTKLRNVETALKFLYNPESSITGGSMNVLQPLLTYVNAHGIVTFSTIYRPNCHEVDRCGSYYNLIGKAVLAAVDILVQVGALDELTVFARSLAKSGDKYYMHEPIRSKIYQKTVIAFMEIAQRDIQNMPKKIDDLGGAQQNDAKLGFKMLAASVHKFLTLKLPYCTEDYVIHRKLKKVLMDCYVRSSGDLDYESTNSLSDDVMLVNEGNLVETSAKTKSKQSELVESMCHKYAELCLLGISAKFAVSATGKSGQQNSRFSYRARCCGMSEMPMQIAQDVQMQIKSKKLQINKKKKQTAAEKKYAGMVTSRSNMPKGFRSSMMNQK